MQENHRGKLNTATTWFQCQIIHCFVFVCTSASNVFLPIQMCLEQPPWNVCHAANWTLHCSRALSLTSFVAINLATDAHVF